MRAILDTSTFLWATLEPTHLSPRVRSIVEDDANQLILSAVTAWEVGVKISNGKLAAPSPLREFFDKFVPSLRLLRLPIDEAHCLRAGELPWHHKDPFDRLLIAQSLVEGVPLLTNDHRIRAYDLEIIW